jgi:predicted ATPase
MPPPPPNARWAECRCRSECACCARTHTPRLVVVTGGPGAGKTALLETARRELCSHVLVLPEAATILFTGGFPRRDSAPARRATQRAIACVQRELERMALEEGAAVVLCDRGTLDGLAYWPGDDASFWDALRATRDVEIARYAAVVHLRPPRDRNGYNRSNPARVESAKEAGEIDARIEKAWEGHPRRTFVPSERDFVRKMRRALAAIRREMPPCCRRGKRQGRT